MGYGLTGYKLKPEDTAQSVIAILNGDTDEEDYQGLAFTNEEKNFIDRCLIEEYSFEKDSFGDWVEYDKNSIQFSVFADYIAIGVPYWAEARNDIRLVFEIVKKITKQMPILFWDPQSGELLDDASDENLEVYEYGLKATNDIIESNLKSAEAEPKSESAWWQFWK